MHIAFSPPDITDLEIAEVVDTLKSGWITTGPKTKLFERQIAEFCHTSRAVCLNSATACLEFVLKLLGIGPGDEVITSAYTYTASASVICHTGAKVVLVDTQTDSFEMDYKQLEKSITKNTKAIISVDIAGILCDYEEIYKIVKRNKELFHADNILQEKMGHIAMVADAAHAFGAKRHNKMCGEIADFTTFSFHAVKNLTTSEGGAVVWKDIKGVDNEELYKEFMLLSLHGQTKDALAKTTAGAWEYDVMAPYYKCNMTDIMASLGLAQLKRYGGMLERRKEIIQYYNNAMKKLPITVLKHYGTDYSSSGHLYLVRLNGKTRSECNDIITRMAEAGVATNVHYKPLPLLNAYKNLGFDIKNYPNAMALFSNEITLPLHTKLTDEEMVYVVEQFTKCVLGE